jgi:hypothetical protein
MHQRDALPDADWHEFDAIIDYWASSRGFQQWWKKIGSGNFSGEFEQFMEAKINKAQQHD